MADDTRNNVRSAPNAPIPLMRVRTIGAPDNSMPVGARGVQYGTNEPATPYLGKPKPAGGAAPPVFIFIGGYGDDTGYEADHMSETIEHYSVKFKKNNAYIPTYYFTHDDYSRIESLLHSINKNEFVVMIGHSMGGNTAGNMVVKYPGLVKVLVLLDPVGSAGGLLTNDRDFFLNIKQSVGYFIDINAVGGDRLDRDNIVAGVAVLIAKHAYNDGPKAIADLYIESHVSHSWSWEMLHDALGTDRDLIQNAIEKRRQ